MSQPAPRLQPLRGEASRIYKLCASKDRATALQGLSLARALGRPLEGILSGVTVNEEGRLVATKRFTGGADTQPVLDALLLQQLGLAAKGTAEAQLREQVRSIWATLPSVPDLSGFTGLEAARIGFTPDFHGASLIDLGSTPTLKRLELSSHTSFHEPSTATLRSLSGLAAPALEEISVVRLGLEDIGALAGSANLRSVALGNNPSLTAIDALEACSGSLEDLSVRFCTSIQSLRPLRNARRLRYLDLDGLELIAGLEDLEALDGLAWVSFSACKALRSLKGLRSKDYGDPRPGWGDKPRSDVVLYGLASLTSLDGMPPLASHVTSLAISSAPLLAGLSGLAPAMPQVRELMLREVAVTDLRALHSFPNLEKLKVHSCPNLADATAIGDLEKLAIVEVAHCDKLESMPEAWKATDMRALKIEACGALKPLKALPKGLSGKGLEVERHLRPKAKPAKALRSDAGSIWKLLSSREVSNILQGLELSASLGEALEAMVEGVAVEDGALARGKRFTGTGPAQPYLDLALFGLMCRATPDSRLSRLREQVVELDLMLCELAPQLDGFTNLARLSLRVEDAITPDLAAFGPMPQLKSLKVTGKRWNATGRLVSLDGLVAPALTEVDLASCGLGDASALRLSPAITRLSLSDNKGLGGIDALAACAPHLVELSLSGCARVPSLEALTGAAHLRTLDLEGCESVTSLKPLAGCTALESLSLERCRALASLEGIEALPICPQPRYSGGLSFVLDGCRSLASLAHLPTLQGKCETLWLDDTLALKSLDGLREFASVTCLVANQSGLEDVANLVALPSVAQISLQKCKGLKDARPLGELTALREADLSGSGVEQLPIGWRGPVSKLAIKGCEALVSLGRLPSTLAALALDGSTRLASLGGIEDCSVLAAMSAERCASLKTLRGLSSCSALQSIALPLSVDDASDLLGLPSVTIRIGIEECQKSAVEGELRALPERFIDAVNALSAVSLEVHGEAAWHAARTFDFSGFGRLRVLKALSFADFNFRCELADLAWLVPLEGLEGLWFAPRGFLAYALGTSVYDSPAKVIALQRRICEAAKMEVPARLDSSPRGH